MKRTIILIILATLLSVACNSTEEASDSTAGALAAEETDPVIDSLTRLCLADTSTDPVEILEKMMSTSYCPMHGPLHHSLVGMALMTAYHNAGGQVDLEKGLARLIEQTKKFPEPPAATGAPAAPHSAPAPSCPSSPTTAPSPPRPGT